MGQFDVFQRTKDGMFNATALLNQWNDAMKIDKRVDHYLNLSSTKEFIAALTEDVATARDYATLTTTDIYVVSTKRKSGFGGKGGNKEVWMSPLLFIDFAMWLNPKFKVQVLKFVYDELIKYRTTAGDNYNVLAKSIAVLPDVDYSQVARGLNWIVFNKHSKDIRNTATPKQLAELDDLQRKLAFSVDMGYIKTFPQLIISMREIYNRQHAKF